MISRIFKKNEKKTLLLYPPKTGRKEESRFCKAVISSRTVDLVCVVINVDRVMGIRSQMLNLDVKIGKLLLVFTSR